MKPVSIWVTLGMSLLLVTGAIAEPPAKSSLGITLSITVDSGSTTFTFIQTDPGSGIAGRARSQLSLPNNGLTLRLPVQPGLEIQKSSAGPLPHTHRAFDNIGLQP